MCLAKCTRRDFSHITANPDNWGNRPFTTVGNPFSAGGLEVVTLLQVDVLGPGLLKIGVSGSAPFHGSELHSFRGSVDEAFSRAHP